MGNRRKAGATAQGRGRRVRTGSALGNTLVQLAIDAPQVMASRMGMFAASGSAPSARDRAEFSRMVWEKQAAGIESWMALWQDAALAWQRAWFDAAFGRFAPIVTGASAARSLNAALAPYQVRASANARRLRRR